MGTSTDRRNFLKASALAGVGFWIAGRDARGQTPATGPATAPSTGPTTSPSEKFNVGFVGVTNQGEYDLREVSNVPGVNVAALCDVDDARLGEAVKKFPDARKYNDFRRMLDEGKDLDGIVIAIPDHMHAFVTMAALQTGKHVYCEKPLTHTVREARLIAETAMKNKRVTQMGTQIHAGDNYRRVVELVEARAIGKISEVHVWCGTQWSAGDPPTDTPPVPAGLHYDLWLGPAEDRPYNPAYLPTNWRRWWAFGTGSLGDMGCHYQDLAFWALKLRHPDRVHAEGPPVNKEGCPPWVAVHYEYPRRGDLPPVRLTWYDGGKKPPLFKEWGLRPEWGSGVMFVGDKGMLFADYGQHKLYPEKDFVGFVPPKPTIPNSIGHHHEWVEACKKGDLLGTTCNFDYAGALSEAVLLGTVAYRVGKPIEWDAKALRVTNAPEAEQFINGHYRNGWSLA